MRNGELLYPALRTVSSVAEREGDGRGKGREKKRGVDGWGDDRREGE